MFYDRLKYGKFTGSSRGFPLTRGSWCKKLKLRAINRISEGYLRESVLQNPQTETWDARKTGGGRLGDGTWLGFPPTRMPWCNSKLKVDALTGFDSRLSGSRPELVQRVSEARSAEEDNFSDSPIAQGAKKNIVHYLGIAADEPERIKRHSVPGKVLPLVDIGWDEAYCRQWCEENNLLSPIYTDSARGGCWFCHNQGVDQLRLLRKNYPELWSLLMKWDKDSPTTFKSDGHTVHDFDKRFRMEDAGIISPGDRRFRWKQVLEYADPNTA